MSERSRVEAPHTTQSDSPMSYDLYRESTTILELRVSSLEKELQAEKELRKEALDSLELDLSKAVCSCD